ncbi:sugar transferase [Devosia ginsengisoli]|uniref:sugar transferase n=1 Tax=Devosia ginsengisoli TaxID=400770 RepID=UPI0026EFE598|nr:sugar transferase [Devosia ginsengisoli]MCR6673612.1 sugar transferase [Devosia ginsengisoli]
MSIPIDGFERTERLTVNSKSGEASRAAEISALRISYHSGLPLMKLLQEPLSFAPSASRDAHMTAKRVFDVIFSMLALLFLLPLLILVAIAVRMESKGPVLFRQTREGFNGSAFGVFKFRSMRREQEDVTGVAHTVRNDKRVTRVGTFLRRTSIDELPQLLNVLRGEMSIVGPRPHVPGMRAGHLSYRALVPYYDHRLAMLPGITGWAQANGLRGDATDPALAHARIDHDLAYIQNFSLWLDLRIILMTIRHEFLGGTGN